jgi:hypothetical protein
LAAGALDSLASQGVRGLELLSALTSNGDWHDESLERCRWNRISRVYLLREDRGSVAVQVTA